jgi:hypothetical protein
MDYCRSEGMLAKRRETKDIEIKARQKWRRLACAILKYRCGSLRPRTYSHDGDRVYDLRDGRRKQEADRREIGVDQGDEQIVETGTKVLTFA